MLYTKQIPEHAQIPADIKILNQFDETSVVGKEFCIIVAELTPEQLEIVKKLDKFPIFNSDADAFESALNTAIWGFLQTLESLEISGLCDTSVMSHDEIDSRLMCCSYIEHVNSLRNNGKLGDITANLLIAKRLDILAIETKALNKEDK